ncbi:MAG: TIGR02281 family clan AA aspartic protease [Erythrobacter sp.]
MLGRTVAFAACVCGFAILMVPREGADEAESAKPSASAGSSTFASGPHSGWASGDHTLDRQSDGHFYASASVDGAAVRMMVDTGASVIALTGRDADAAGLHWDEAEVRVIGQGASGAVYGVPARLREVEIGGIVRRNVNAVIIPEGLGVSLLGQSWLAQVDGVEITDDQMVLRTD